MKPIKAILADADGTLIENGDLVNINDSLKGAIRSLRSKGVLFSLASGRSYHQQEILFHNIISPEKPHPFEGILYEASAVRIFGQEEHHLLGAFSPCQKSEIVDYSRRNNLFMGLTPSRFNELYLSYLTPSFIERGKTDENLLQQKYEEAKQTLERHFSYLTVTKSADAIDITLKWISKGEVTKKYSELTRIPLSEIAAVGDSGNDLPMLEVVGKAGGLVIYVGKKKEQEEIVRGYKHHFIPEQKGPRGTTEAINHLLKNYC